MVTKIVLTYCEKKGHFCSWCQWGWPENQLQKGIWKNSQSKICNTVLIFDALKEFEKKLSLLEQFIWTVKGQNNFWQQNSILFELAPGQDMYTNSNIIHSCMQCSRPTPKLFFSDSTSINKKSNFSLEKLAGSCKFFLVGTLCIDHIKMAFSYL